MLAETKTMTVAAARELLTNVRDADPAVIDAAEKVIHAFHAARPRQQCIACRGMFWTEHLAADGGSVWACSGCHQRPLSAEEWNTLQGPSLAASARKAAAIKKLAAKE